MLWSFFRTSRAVGQIERGIASIEFVIILPVMMIMLAVATDVGRMLMDHHAVIKSVRDAARYLSRVDAGTLGINCGGTPSLDMTTTEAQNAMRLAMTGRINGDTQLQPLVKAWRAATVTSAATGITITAECMTNSGLTGTYSSLGGFYSGDAVIPAVRVSADVPFHFKLAGIVGIGPTINMTISHKMPHIGQ